MAYKNGDILDAASVNKVIDNSSEAVTTANSAKTASSEAVATANSAKTSSTEAVTTANASKILSEKASADVVILGGQIGEKQGTTILYNKAVKARFNILLQVAKPTNEEWDIGDFWWKPITN